MTRTFLAAVGALALVGAGQAQAFQKLPDGTTTEERENTARLNAQQAANAQAEIAAYNQSVATAEEQQASAQAAYAEETAAYEAEKDRLAAMSAEERMQWEADVAACKAGDTSRCAPPAPKPQL